MAAKKLEHAMYCDPASTCRCRVNDQCDIDQGNIRGNGGVDVPVAGLIEIRMAPLSGMIAMVRTVASEIASRADFDLDTVADVRMAVDEACNQVALHADPDHQMRVAFGVHADGYLRVTISARARPGSGGLDTTGFG
jgi:serine/threonine-protein kinase RsbW